MKTKMIFECTNCHYRINDKQFIKLLKYIKDQFTGLIGIYPCPDCDNNLWFSKPKTAKI